MANREPLHAVTMATVSQRGSKGKGRPQHGEMIVEGDMASVMRAEMNSNCVTFSERLERTVQSENQQSRGGN